LLWLGSRRFDYRTFPDELYQCVPFESPDPLLGGACPEEFIVRGGEADVQREPDD
jgi:hypothetical protein